MTSYEFEKAAKNAVVRVMKEKHDLTADGIVGPKTWKALGVIPGQDKNLNDTADDGNNTVDTSPAEPDGQQDGVWLPMEDWLTVKAAFAAAQNIIKKYE